MNGTATAGAPVGDDENPFLTAALAYAHRGWSVFPLHTPGPDGLCTCGAVSCQSPGKHPRTPAGLHDATGNPERIRDWWTRWPRAGIGVRTGRDFFCLDIDPRHGGEEALAALVEKYGPLPATRTHRTGGGGLHYLFRCVDPMTGKPVKISSSSGKIGPGLDVKGWGGYIVMPPSLHVSGGSYEILDDSPIADAPRWLFNLITSRGRSQAPRITVPERIREGQRNDTLFRLASSLRARGLSETAIREALHAENAAKCDPPLPRDEVDRIAESAGQYPEGEPVPRGRGRRGGGNETPPIDFAEIAEEIRRNLHVISVRQNLFYRDEGVYLPNKGQIEAEIQRILTDLEYEKSIVNAKREVLSYLADYQPYATPPFNKHYGYLPVKNGILHITKGEITILPYTDDYFFSYRLPVSFDPDADPGPVLDTFTEWVDEENVVYLIQLPAQAVVQSWGDCYKTAYLFEGKKDAGKTTYFEFLTATIGSQNIANASLADLLFNRYSKYDLLGKILNLDDDLAEIPLKNLGEFKKLTGGMPVTVERKFCDRISTTLPAVHAFTCNVPPVCKVIDDPAWWSRWVYVYFGNTFPRNPEWKKQFITNENLSGFLLLIINAVRDMMAGKFYRMDPAVVEMLWTSASDTVSKFIHEECELKPGAEVQKDVLYDAYRRHCEKSKKDPIMKNVFTQELARRGITTERPRVGGKRIHIYRGVILKRVTNNPDRPDQSLFDDTGGQGGQGFSYTIARARETDDRKGDCVHICLANNPDHPDQINTDHDKVCKVSEPLVDAGPGVEGDGAHTPLSPSVPSVPNVPARNEPLSEKEAQNDVGTPGTRSGGEADILEPTLNDLVALYNLPPDPDLGHHIRFTKKGTLCICLGCGRPAMWHGQDPIRPMPLCDGHYAKLIEAARRDRQGVGS